MLEGCPVMGQMGALPSLSTGPQCSPHPAVTRGHTETQTLCVVASAQL